MTKVRTNYVDVSKLNFLRRYGFDELVAPYEFRCDECGKTVFKGLTYYRKLISKPSGVDDYCICLICASFFRDIL